MTQKTADPETFNLIAYMLGKKLTKSSDRTHRRALAAKKWNNLSSNLHRPLCSVDASQTDKASTDSTGS